MPSSVRARRFVRALLAGAALPAEGTFWASRDGRRASLPEAEVRALAADGVVTLAAGQCTANALTAAWLRRQLLAGDAFAAQHRIESAGPAPASRNLAESPLARLATAAAGEAAPFLMPHQVEAGERLRRLCARARLQQRVTMSYSAAHTAGGGGAGMAADLGDLAADARRRLDELHGVLPRDCAGVVLDVCGFDKGLQQIESERGWPRRSAKLVLRIGLDALAAHWGLAGTAAGPERTRQRGWRDGARPAMFPEG